MGSNSKFSVWIVRSIYPKASFNWHSSLIKPSQNLLLRLFILNEIVLLTICVWGKIYASLKVFWVRNYFWQLKIHFDKKNLRICLEMRKISERKLLTKIYVRFFRCRFTYFLAFFQNLSSLNDRLLFYYVPSLAPESRIYHYLIIMTQTWRNHATTRSFSHSISHALQLWSQRFPVSQSPSQLIKLNFIV